MTLLRFLRCFFTGCDYRYQHQGKLWRVVCPRCRRVGPWLT